MPLAPPAFTLFAFLWCVAVLFHQLFQGRFAILDPTAFLSFAALFCALRPGSLRRFLLVLAVHLATVVYELPKVSNHWLLMGITSLGLLVALVPCAFATDPDRQKARLLAVLPTIRAQLILLYVLAALAKLNAGFFDLAHSCGAEHYRRLAARVPIFPRADWALHTAVVGTLLIEAGLPVLLAVRRTRLLAIAGGWVFHLMLGFNGYWDFSMAASAYYAAFVPERILAGAHRVVGERAGLRRLREAAERVSVSPAAFPVAAAVLLVPAGVTALSGVSARDVVMFANGVGRWVFVVAWAGLGAALLLSWRAAPAAAEPGRPGRAWWWHPALALGPALVFLNGFSPYLGLKTESSYTMFSNIRTEGATWNHYVVPRQLRVFGFQDEPLPLVSSSDPSLERLAEHGYRMLPFELRRWAQQHPNATVVYDTPEGRQRTSRVADDPRLSQPVNPLLAKLLLFRPVPPPERNVCLH